MNKLTYDWLRESIAGNAAAFRCLTRLTPVGGEGDKVFPPTYKHPDADTSMYAFEERRIGGRQVRTVLLDSVASQANRLEESLLRAFEGGECDIPVLSVTVPRSGDGANTRVTALDAPHRITDAIFRDSDLDGKRFRDSPLGRRLAQAKLDNATAVFQLCPTALFLGFWDSQSEAGAQGARVARALVSEIIGLDAVSGRRTGSRIDPLAITASAAKVYRSETDMWTLDEKDAVKEKNKPKLYGEASKAGKPSAINHGNVTPSVSSEDQPGGVTISEALQTTVLSLPQLRRLRFPDIETGETTPERDIAGRLVLAALALYALALHRRDGYFLRSRCHLIPVEATPRDERLGASAQDVNPFTLTVDDAREAFDQAREKARASGLSWKAGLIQLQPTKKLVELVRRSDEKVRTEGGDDAGN
jgi:CRISPR-associated protein Csb1